jgi:DNA polymerase
MTEEPVSALSGLLRWYAETGVDAVVQETPRNRFLAQSAPPPPAAMAAARPIGSNESEHSPLATAVSIAASAASLDELKRRLATFDACPLHKTATNLVFGEGIPQARVVLIGEAPGAEEDRIGRPFVGPSGRLLDQMLASIGLDRSHVFISNTVFWRPPGNRSPTHSETAMCLPFVERIIELIDPRLLVALGGPAANALLAQKESIGRLRGRWFTFQTPRLPRPLTTIALFHPAYLLRSPAQKRLAWRDLLSIKARLQDDRHGT